MACITKDEYLNQIKQKYPNVTQDELTELGNIFEKNKGNLNNVVDYLNSVNNNAKPFIMPKLEYKEFKGEDTVNDVITTSILKANNYASTLISSGIIPLSQKGISKIPFDKFDKWAIKNIPLYVDAKDKLTDAWESNTAIQQLRFYVNPSNIGELFTNFNKLNTMFHIAKQNNIKLMDETAKQLDTRLAAAYDEKTIKVLDDVLAKSAIFNLEQNGELLRLLENDTTLTELINTYEAKVGNLKYIADNLSKVYLHEDLKGISGLKQNIEQYNVVNLKAEIETLASLYSLNKIDKSVELLQDMYTNNKDLYNDLIHLTVAVKAMNNKVFEVTNDIKISRGNLIDDIQQVDYDVMPITAEDWGSKQFNEEQGWKILRAPNHKGQFGIIYREKTDTLMEGMGTNVSYTKTGIPITLNYVSNSHYYDNYTDNGFIEQLSTDGKSTKVLALTEEERNILGFHNDPVKSLLRAYAHSNFILETNAVRDALIDGFRYDGEGKTADEINKDLEEAIAANKHPIYIKLPQTVTYQDLSKTVKAKFMYADKALGSDIKAYKNKFNLIRKDVGFQVEGFREGNVFKNYSANYYHSKIKELIRYLKTNSIVLNAPKIVMDMISSITLVLSKGASFQEVFKYGQEAAKLSSQMVELRNERLELLLALDGTKNAEQRKVLESKLKKKEEEIANHDFSPALANGFIQSLGTEMLTQDRESVRGLEVEMNRIISKLTELPDGERTQLGKLIMRFSKFGFNGEAVYLYIGAKLEKYGPTQGIGNIVKGVGEELKAIKSKEDAKAYMGMMIATPSSPLVRFGGAMTLYADLIPRWILYKHNKNAGMTEEQATQDALLSLLDYKITMPPSLKFMNDLYLMPYPSFFLRIQRVLLGLLEKNPVSLSVNLLSNELIGNHGQNILGSNIFTKFEKGTIFTNPFDIINVDNAIPYSNLLG